MYLRHDEGFILSQLWVPVYTNYFYVKEMLLVTKNSHFGIHFL